MSEPQTNFFYVGTRGCSASVWMSYMLSKHRHVAAFHGAGVADYFPGPKGASIPPLDYAQDLVRMKGMTGGEKTFGAVHMYFHPEDMLDACEKLGGTYTYVVRHPVKRFFSLFWSQVEADLGQHFKDEAALLTFLSEIEQKVQQTLENITLDDIKPLIMRHTYMAMDRFSPEWFAMNLQPWKKNKKALWQTDCNELEASVLKLFFEAIVNTTYFDMRSYDLVGTKGLITFEKMTTDPQYFKTSVLETIMPEYEADEAYLSEVFEADVINPHTKQTSKNSWEDVIEKLPKAFQQTFVRLVEQHTINSDRNLYEVFGYELPK